MSPAGKIPGADSPQPLFRFLSGGAGAPARCPKLGNLSGGGESCHEVEVDFKVGWGGWCRYVYLHIYSIVRIVGWILGQVFG